MAVCPLLSCHLLRLACTRCQWLSKLQLRTTTPAHPHQRHTRCTRYRLLPRRSRRRACLRTPSQFRTDAPGPAAQRQTGKEGAPWGRLRWGQGPTHGAAARTGATRGRPTRICGHGRASGTPGAAATTTPPAPAATNNGAAEKGQQAAGGAPGVEQRRAWHRPSARAAPPSRPPLPASAPRPARAAAGGGRSFAAVRRGTDGRLKPGQARATRTPALRCAASHPPPPPPAPPPRLVHIQGNACAVKVGLNKLDPVRPLRAQAQRGAAHIGVALQRQAGGGGARQVKPPAAAPPRARRAGSKPRQRRTPALSRQQLARGGPRAHINQCLQHLRLAALKDQLAVQVRPLAHPLDHGQHEARPARARRAWQARHRGA